MKLREAIEIIAKGYASDGKRFDEAFELALLAVSAHEARVAAQKVGGSYQVDNWRKQYDMHCFEKVCLAERELNPHDQSAILFGQNA